MSNASVLQQSLEKFRRIHADITQNQLIPMLDKLIYDLFQDAYTNWGGEYLGFTGNTITSISAAVYLDGKLQFIRQMGKTLSMKEPVHRKISAPNVIRLGEGSYSNKGKNVSRGDIYDGPARFMRAKVVANENEYGWEMAASFLTNTKPKISKGLTVIVCTGTEYSDYLESVRHFNVLKSTADNTANLYRKALTQYIKGNLS